VVGVEITSEPTLLVQAAVRIGAVQVADAQGLTISLITEKLLVVLPTDAVIAIVKVFPIYPTSDS